MHLNEWITTIELITLCSTANANVVDLASTTLALALANVVASSTFIVAAMARLNENRDRKNAKLPFRLGAAGDCGADLGQISSASFSLDSFCSNRLIWAG